MYVSSRKSVFSKLIAHYGKTFFGTHLCRTKNLLLQKYVTNLVTLESVFKN